MYRKQGTAMGTKAAVAYANNAVGHFENLHVYTYKQQPLLYIRFIDDIFIIWTEGETALKQFIDHLNSATTFFKFTKEISDKKVDSLM